jgi:hypothetical protein
MRPWLSSLADTGLVQLAQFLGRLLFRELVSHALNPVPPETMAQVGIV